MVVVIVGAEPACELRPAMEASEAPQASFERDLEANPLHGEAFRIQAFDPVPQRRPEIRLHACPAHLPAAQVFGSGSGGGGGGGTEDELAAAVQLDQPAWRRAWRRYAR
jgi:hypothetical protein